MIKVKVRTMCRVPVPSALVYELEDCELIETLSFQPAVGQRLRLAPFKDPVRVASVEWDAADPKHLVAWLTEPDRGQVAP